MMTERGSSESTVRETLERALTETSKLPVPKFGAFFELHKAVTEALTQLSALERDHEAMEKIRVDFADCGFRYDGNFDYEIYCLTPYEVNTGYVPQCDDPADAILGTQEKNDG